MPSSRDSFRRVISPRHWLWLWLMALAPALSDVAAAAEPATRPNVVFVLIDDFGWADASCFGGQVPTPAIDALAREGLQFRQFYVASPICSASRCAFLTGQFPARQRITSYLQTRAGNRECEQVDFLDTAAPSLARMFQSAGYATGHVGKWHLGGGRDVTDAPKFAEYGFDFGLGTYESPQPAAALGLKSLPWSEELEPQQVPRHDRTRWMIDRGVAFLKANAGRPRYLQLWLDDTHTPFRPSDEQLARAAAGEKADLVARHRAVLTECDRQIGRLLVALKEMGIDDETLILLSGDNGPEPSFDGLRTGGLRGMKWSLYEGGIRTPLIARLRGVVPSGVVDETSVVSAVDIMPTLAALANLPMPTNQGDGQDMSAAFQGRPVTRDRPLFWEYGRKPASGGGVPRAFPYPTEPRALSPNVAVRDGRWKLLVHADGSRMELFDVLADPTESRDVAERQPEVAERLRRAALEWRGSLPSAGDEREGG